MFRKTTIMLWVLFPMLVGAAHACPKLVDHQFTSRLQNGLPHDNVIFVPADVENLYLVMTVASASVDTLVMTWGTHPHRVDVGVIIGPDTSRIWSSRRLPAQQKSINVALSTDSGCTLGQFTLHRLTKDYPALTLASSNALPVPLPVQLHHLLYQDDITGFRLESRAQHDVLTSQQRTIVARIEATTIPLMQLEKDINNDLLYVAGGRAEHLAQHPDLDSQQRRKLQKLTQTLRQRTRHLNRQINHQLSILETLLARSAVGLHPCPDNAGDASALWRKYNPGLPLKLTDRDTTNPQVLRVMDTRTGEIHALQLSCVTLFDQAPPKNR